MRSGSGSNDFPLNCGFTLTQEPIGALEIVGVSERTDIPTEPSKDLQAHNGGRTDEAIRYDADFEDAIGDFITGYLAERPAPVDSAAAHGLAQWADALQARARSRRAALGTERHLRAVA
jgi:hypothetical protein